DAEPAGLSRGFSPVWKALAVVPSGAADLSARCYRTADVRAPPSLVASGEAEAPARCLAEVRADRDRQRGVFCVALLRAVSTEQPRESRGGAVDAGAARRGGASLGSRGVALRDDRGGVP